jgi:hypothetical protein
MDRDLFSYRQRTRVDDARPVVCDAAHQRAERRRRHTRSGVLGAYWRLCHGLDFSEHSAAERCAVAAAAAKPNLCVRPSGRISGPQWLLRGFSPARGT